MKYNLNLVERLTLLNMLPEQGNFVTLKIVRKLRESLSLSEDEIKYFGIKQEGNQVTWNAERASETKELEIGEKALDIIQEVLKKLNSENKLTVKEFSLYETFVENVKEE